MRVAEIIKKRSVAHGLLLLFLLALGFLFYGRTLSVGFLSDDWHALLVAKETDNIFHFFTTNIVGSREGSSYGPMWNMVTFLQYHVFGLHAAWYHATSIVLVAATACFLFKLTQQLFRKKQVAYGAAILFMIAPSHVEPIAWVAGQPHLFAACFYVLSLYYYAKFSSQQKTTHYVVSFVAIAFSLLTKEIAIPFLGIFLLIDIWFERLSIKKGRRKESALRMVMWYLPFVALVAIYMFARQYATGVLAGYYGSETIAVSLRDIVQMGTQMTVGLFWSYPLRDGVAVWVLADTWRAAAIVVLFIGTILLLCKKHIRAVGFATFLYLISLVPYMSLHYSSHGNEGERYTYLPSLFAAMGIAWVLYCTVDRIYRSRALFGIFLTLLVGVSWAIVQEKNNHWILAGSIVSETLPTIAELPLDQSRALIFVALPDQIQGAQLFRNGTFEALRLLGYGKYQGERVFISPLVFSTYREDQALVSVGPCEGQVIELVCFTSAQPVDRLFTGLSLQQVGNLVFILEDFRKKDYTGTGIRIEGVIMDEQIVYFNNNSFQLLRP